MLAAAALVTGACGDNEIAVDAPPRCDEAACAPYACELATDRCYRSCRNDTMCDATHVCMGSACIGTACTAETATQVCGAYACVNGECARDCAIGPCADGYYCRPDTLACMPRCTRRGDVACGGYVCDLEVGECEAYCMDGELPCAAGYVCGANHECGVDTSAPSCAAGCGAYACLEQLGLCATRCVDSNECAPAATCDGGSCT